jgi:hypothetical protein
MSSYSNPIPVPFNADDQRPLPELIAQGNPNPVDGWPAFPMQMHDVEGVRYYAVQDWIFGIAQVKNARRFWVDLKGRLKKANYTHVYAACVQLPYNAADGKEYKMDFARAETLYQITQRMNANTGVRDRVLRYLAFAGVLVDEARLDPNSVLGKAFGPNPDLYIEAAIEGYRAQGKSDVWIASRILGTQMRKAFTAAFQKSLRRPASSPLYAVITDTMRIALWQRNTRTIKRELGLPEKGGNVRDHMTMLALSYELLAENLSTAALDQKHNLEFNEAKVCGRSGGAGQRTPGHRSGHE